MIDRYALVTRHNPVLNSIDYETPLTVGNGEFAFTVDVTGMQTLYSEYAKRHVPLCTMSQWGWHTEPAETREYRFPIKSARDDFDGDKLDLAYVSPRIPLGEKASLTERKGYLRLYGQESFNSLHRVSLVAIKQSEYCVHVETAMDFHPSHPEQLAGLAYFYDAMNAYVFGKTVDEDQKEVLVLIKSDSGIITDAIVPIPIELGKTVYLRAVTNETGQAVRFSYSYDAKVWMEIEGEYSTEILTDEHCRGFTGAHFGMYCHDMTGAGCYADFDYFLYENNPRIESQNPS